MSEMPRVAVVARSVFPLHGPGGLERSVYDLVRYLARAGVGVTLITRTPPARPDAGAIDSRIAMRFVSYRTFPLAGRRGTTVLDRSTAYPLFGERAGRVAWQLVEQGAIDLVHGFGASVLGYARRRAKSKAPLVLNPQGLEEFGATDPSRARLKRAAYLPLRHAVLACAHASDAVIATDRALEPAVLTHLEGRPLARPRHPERARPDDGRRPGISRRRPPCAPGGRYQGRRCRPAERGPSRTEQGVSRSRRRSCGAQPTFRTDRRRQVALGDPRRWTVSRIGSSPRVRDAGLAAQVHMPGRIPDSDAPCVVRGGRPLRPSHAVRRQFAGDAGSHGAPPRGRRDDRGGPARQGAPGVSGWLVPPGDPSALAAAISGALGEPARLPAMGLAGRAMVEREFSWEAAGAATLRLYSDLLR